MNNTSHSACAFLEYLNRANDNSAPGNNTAKNRSSSTPAVSNLSQSLSSHTTSTISTSSSSSSSTATEKSPPMLLPLTENIKSEKKNPTPTTTHWWYTIYLFSFISLACCILQIMLPPPFCVLMTSAEVAKIGIAPEGCQDGMSRCICPRTTVCATNLVSLILLTIARCSAIFDYPLYMMMFFSKCHNLNNILRRTILREFIDFGDMHHIHSIFGVVIGIETMSHSIFHTLRWSINNELHLLWDTATGITGIIACTATVAIVWPMCIPALKRRMSFEARKCLHYLFWVWALALMWHAPSRIVYLIGVPLAIYCADFLVGLFVRTHLLENVYFERYGKNGVAVSKYD
jgi:hypothetical protein